MTYKDKNCLECESEYSPNSSTQKYCFNCGKEKKKEYHKKYLKEYHEKNKEKANAKCREYYQENKSKIKEQKKGYAKKYYQESKPKRKEYLQKNEDRIKKNKKEYSQIPKVKKRTNERARKNYQRPDIKKRKREYKRQRIKNDRVWAIQLRISCLFRNALRVYTKTGKIMSFSKYGINYQEIIEHLKPFPEDISLYHVDHIKPLCSFNLENPEEIKKAFAPENHQWLTIGENLRKGGKY